MWRQFKQFHLTENMRLINSDDQEEKDFAEFLLKIGNGEVEESDQVSDSAEMVIRLPEKFLSKASTARELCAEIYPSLDARVNAGLANDDD